MNYDPKTHHRRSIRLEGYNYSQEGLYFITICTENNNCIFGKIKDGEMQLNEMGTIAYNEWLQTPVIRKNIRLDVFFVMPNHIHGIIVIRWGVLHSPSLHTPSLHTPIAHPPKKQLTPNHKNKRQMNHIFTLLLFLLFLNASAQKISNPHVDIENAEGTNCTISLYHPFGLNIQLRHIRPDFTPENYLCVPGAYTSIATQIDGLYIEDGIEINETINNKLTGACILSNDSIQFMGLEEINSQLINQVKSSKKSMFQQSLLVKNNQIVPCDLFHNKENLRRALIQFKDNYFLIGESQRRVTIGEFQEALVNIGAINAINLDMGTWSEGWYKNHGGEKITVGEKMFSTNKQTNWIIYTKP